MKKYTQAEFDAIKRDEDGYLRLPTGDYCDIDFDGASRIIIGAGSELGNSCTLGNGCKLGDECKLGNRCTLGNRCKLGNRCTLGDRCKLGDGCTLDDWCTLGNGCTLDDGCTLGNWCTLGNGCTLGNCCTLGNGCKLDNCCTLGNCCKLGNCCTLGSNCALGNRCTLGDGCSLESDRVHNATYFKVSNIGSRNDSAYCYCDTRTGEIYVRAGCWFSGIDDFVKRVHDMHADTQHEVDYLAMVEFARARFARSKKVRGENNG